MFQSKVEYDWNEKMKRIHNWSIICLSKIFENLNKGLSELYRVLNSNGTLLILEFSQPKNNLFGYFFNFYFKYILPTFGKMFSKNKVAYKYLFQSVQQFPSVNDMKKNLSSQGFINVNAKTLSMGIATIYTASK